MPERSRILFQRSLLLTSKGTQPGWPLKKPVRNCLLVGIFLNIFLTGYGQCVILKDSVFVPQTKRVVLVAPPGDTTGAYSVIAFRTSLRVNTDGAPTSYHPQDESGTQKALNSLCHAISVSKVDKAGLQTKLSCAEATPIITQFRDSNWVVPAGYVIQWDNVLASRTEKGRTIPCVFTQGDYKGYFGSLTSLKNNVRGAEAGECDCHNQLDQRFIPAFVIPGGENIVRWWGADVGDLVIVYNPDKKIICGAVVGDSGPANKLGEGSIALNMALLGITKQPKTYKEVLQLDTGDKQMLVVLIPGSKKYHPRTPFAKENIQDRIQRWLLQAGFSSQQQLVDSLQTGMQE